MRESWEPKPGRLEFKTTHEEEDLVRLGTP